MAFEALNNAGVTENIRLLVVLNDNDMSISPAVGGLNRYLARLMSGRFYAAAKQAGKQVLKNFPPVFELAPSRSRNTPRAWWCRGRCSRNSVSTTSDRSMATISIR